MVKDIVENVTTSPYNTTRKWPTVDTGLDVRGAEMNVEHYDIVTLREAAERLEIKVRNLTRLYERRHTNGFPQPIKYIKHSLILFDYNDIEVWYEKYSSTRNGTGRRDNGKR
jgi:predicted DNA-binding transcriptional regulator AlpA